MKFARLLWNHVKMTGQIRLERVTDSKHIRKNVLSKSFSERHMVNRFREYIKGERRDRNEQKGKNGL